MPNSFAYLMLIIWPAACLFLFRRLPVERAIIWSILAGYLILPQQAEFDLPLVPDMDKVSIPNISAFVLCIFYLKKPVSLWPSSWFVRILLISFVLGVVPTVMTNGDAIVFKLLGETEPIVFSSMSLPGLGLRDLFSVVSNQAIILMPFFLARTYLSSEVGMRDLLLALVIGAVVYSIPALIEIRLSPQINVWVYGFFQHDFEQMIRNGGFRPIVFLPHALWIAFFFMTAAVSAVALSRGGSAQDRIKYLCVAVYLMIVLLLSKSLASMLYGMLLAPLFLLASPRMVIRVAVGLAMIAVIYPVLRDNGLIPLEGLLAQAEAINPDRALSLGYRFDNEERLLARAHEKWLFGWGGWGRNLVRDAQTGEILSIPDGEWIIVFGTFGWVGYLSKMGLLAVPLFLLAAKIGKVPAQERSIYAAPLAAMLAITMIDMLLNAILTPFTWLIAGALLGYTERISVRLNGSVSTVEKTHARTVLQPDIERRKRTSL